MSNLSNGDQHISDHLPAYALGVLDDQERRSIDAHLKGCELCQAELRAYQEVAGELAYTVCPHEPPAHLRSFLVSAAAADRSRVVEPKQYSFTQRLAQLFRNFNRPAFAALAILLIIILLASNFVLLRQVQDLRSIAYAKPKVVQLAAAAAQPTAGGILLIQNKGVNGILIVDGMQPLTKEQQYQLWLIRDGVRTSGGVFSVNEVGYGYLRVENPKPLGQYDSIGITVEPFGGSPGPTSPKVLGAQL